MNVAKFFFAIFLALVCFVWLVGESSWTMVIVALFVGLILFFKVMWMIDDYNWKNRQHQEGDTWQ